MTTKDQHINDAMDKLRVISERLEMGQAFHWNDSDAERLSDALDHALFIIAPQPVQVDDVPGALAWFKHRREHYMVRRSDGRAVLCTVSQ